MNSEMKSDSSWFQWVSERGTFWEVIARQHNFSSPMGPPVMLKAESDGTAASELVSVGTMLSSAQLGLLTGVLMILFIRHKFTRIKEEMAESKAYSFAKNIKLADVRKFLFIVVTFLEFCLLAPVFFLIYTGFKCYRSWVALVLKQRYGSHFKGLLDGTDVVWAMQRDNSRGMINVMAYIEEPAGAPSSRGSTISAELLILLRKRISSRLMRSYRPHPKVFWKRNLELGYYYWSDQSELCIEDYIRYLELIPLEENEQHIDERKLRTLVSEISNRYLPGSHTSSWEILVGRQPLLNKARNMLRFPIIFRVHHSLGDGVALLRLLLEGIVDKEDPSPWKRLSTLKVMNLDYIMKERSNCDIPQESFLRKLLRKIPTAREIYLWKRKNLQLLWTIFTAPAFFHEVAARKVDSNFIHSEEHSNKKVVSWINEDETGSTHLIDIIKQTKQQLPGARFSDAFLTALSSSLEKYFVTRTNESPKDITVVLPTRIEMESPQLKLQNRFSVALQTLPIFPGIDLKQPHQLPFLLGRLAEVKQHSDALRSSPDYLINYWIMSSVACLFPDAIVSKLIKSAHSTLAISNLPGPQQKPRIGGHELKSVNFWIPNIGQTAVGISLLTYGGKLQLGILADSAVIPTEDDAHSILVETIAEIERMGAILEDSWKASPCVEG